MNINDVLSEMLAYASEHPYNRSTPRRPFQRELDTGLALTCYLEGGYGRLSLAAPGEITEAELRAAETFLRPYDGILLEGETQNEYRIVRFTFYYPARNPSRSGVYLPDAFSRPFAVSEYDFGQEIPSTIEGLPDPRPSPHVEPSPRVEPVSVSPSWEHLRGDRCHICHRFLEDPLSIRVQIGIHCRERIQRSEGKTEKMWDDISSEELERLWADYNIYDLRRARKVG